MRFISYITLMTAAGMVAGCSLAEREGEGVTAVDASSQLNLDANHVVPGIHAGAVTFHPGSAELDNASASALAVLADDGVQTVHVFVPAHDLQQKERSESLMHFLRGHGIDSNRIIMDSDADLPANTYRVEVAVMSVAQPDCPNWSSDATSSYTNMPWSQLGCAEVSNLGAMVADPADLTLGSGNVHPDAARASVVTGQYRSNKDWSPAATGGGATASGTQFGGGGGGSATSSTQQGVGSGQ